MIIYFIIVSSTCLSAKTKGATSCGSFLFLRQTEGNPRVRHREALAQQESLSFRKKQKELPRVAPFLCQEVSSYNFFRGKPL